MLELEVNLPEAIHAQSFRAEFVQTEYATSTAAGPRIYELDGYDTLFGVQPEPIPEPTTMLLFGMGLIGLAGMGRKRIFRKD